MRPLNPLLPAVLAAAASPAAAHGVAAPQGPGWTLDPWILAALGLSALVFGAGAIRLLARTGQGRRRLVRRIGLFAAGWLVLAGAVVSPLHQAGERSFAAHMLEHELLMLAAAPLLALSEPLAVMLWAMPATARQTIGAAVRAPAPAAAWSALSAPMAATLLQAAALWLWHAPALFERALQGGGWHIAQHLSFLVTALLFWSAMLRRRAERLLSVLCLFVTALVSGALGAFMAFASSPWYTGYARLGLTPLSLTPAEDQQAAGLLMWIPGGLVHAAAALVILGALLRAAPPAPEAADAV